MPTRKERKLIHHEAYVQLMMDRFELYRCSDCGRLFALSLRCTQEMKKRGIYNRNYDYVTPPANYALRHAHQPGTLPVWTGFKSLKQWCIGYVQPVIDQVPTLSLSQLNRVITALDKRKYETYFYAEEAR
jgi:hypothetical protein